MAATSTMNGPLNEGAVGELLELVQPNKPASLPILWLVTELSASGVVQKAVASYPVYQRSGGFMVAVPALEEVKNFLDAVSGGDDGEAASHQVEVELVTNRGRLLGRVDRFLVDLPWAFLGHFQRVPRGASAPQFEVVHFSLGGTQGKPSVKSVRTAADNWIGQGMDDTTAQDYFTGEELEPQDTGDDEELELEAAPTTGTPPADVTSLETQIKQLQRELAQTRLQQASNVNPPGADVVVTPAKARALFTGSRAQQQINPTDWARLQQLAGPPPTRGTRAGVGVGQQIPSQQPQVTDQKNSLLLELDRGAMEAGEVEKFLTNEPVGSTMEQLLMTQIQQNSLLLQKLVAGKPADPLMAALSGSDSGSGSSSGVKGCVARETYLKAIQDLVGIAEVVKQNAMTELGMTADREDSSIMRRFVERKMALADHRTLGYIATLAAEGWAVAHETSNLPMMGFLSKLMFVEQTCLDQGKTQLAWLLTGCADPAFNLHHGRKAHSSLRPFSTLARASWVSANIAYLKDLDYLEGRMVSIGRPVKPPKDDSSEAPDRTPKVPKPKKKGQGKGKEQQTEAADA